MRPQTTEDILALMDGSIVSAALGAAMESGIFWFLAEKPLTAEDVAEALTIPLNRCHIWLQILCRLGLLENDAEAYAPSAVAREAILNALSQDTWAFQAREYRDSFQPARFALKPHGARVPSPPRGSARLKRTVAGDTP